MYRKKRLFLGAVVHFTKLKSKKPYDTKSVFL